MLLVPMTVLLVLRSRTSLDVRWFSPYGHLLVVSGIAACALVVAAVAVYTAARSTKPGVVWLGLGCTIVGLAMLAHGLTTPGVFGRGPNSWVGRLPYVAMVGLTVSLAASGTAPNRRLNRWVGANAVTAISVPVALIAGAIVAIVADPQIFGGGGTLQMEESALDIVAITCGAVLVPVIVTHWYRWHLGRDIVQLALVFAASMCIAALVSFEHGVFGRLSWWDYHAYLLAGFGCTAYAVMMGGKRARAVDEVLAATFDDDAFEVIASGHPEALRSMIRAVELKDAYTRGHSERTARLAVELGVRMHLAPERLRVISRGGFLHDLGKIGIPDQILNKPGRLDAAERAVIETHPRLGYEIASTARTLRETLPIILHHHERMDGGGYPDGLAGTDIPLEARVVTVADVWDALTSRRAYRDPMAPQDALAHIVAGSGTHFDPRVVLALVEHLRDAGVRTGAEGEAETAWEAAQTCHEIDELEGVLTA
jgi:hypothetical protein